MKGRVVRPIYFYALQRRCALVLASGAPDQRTKRELVVSTRQRPERG